MNKPNGWDEAQAYDGNYKTLPAGGYVCAIRSGRVEAGKFGDQMVLALDICEGDYAGFFNDAFQSKKKKDPNAKWPCVFYQSILNKDNLTNGWFKGLITSVERSNPGYVWNWDENTLKGKFIGFVFGEEEWEAQDGSIRTNTKPKTARDRQAIRDGDFIIPPKKLIEKSNSSFVATEAGFTEVEDEMLPF